MATKNKDISSKERFILMGLLVVLLLIYWVFGVFKKEMNEIVKALPFLAVAVYIVFRTRVRRR